MRGASPEAVIGRLNPIIRGWAAYNRSFVSSKVFAALDHYVWRLLYQWACHRHPKKSKHWITARYFGKFNKDREDKWVFGDRDSGAYLHKFAWTPITRHALVKGRASPDDPALAQYWADRRRRRQPPPLAPSMTRQIKKQRGRCEVCGDYLLFADHEPQSPSQWEAWFIAIRTAIVKTAVVTRAQGRPGVHGPLVHAFCLPPPEDSDDPGGITTDSTACTPSRPA
jgi:RNA-directed DNA polymerase